VHPATPFTDAQKQQSVEDAYQTYLQTGRIHLYTYTHLHSLGLLPLTDAEKWKLIETAHAQLTASFSRQKLHSWPAIRNTTKRALALLAKVKIGNTRTLPSNLINEAQRLAVRQYFEKRTGKMVKISQSCSK
jgi:hypothetical protein